MTMRKPNYAEQMQELRNEIETTEAFVNSAVKEITSLDQKNQSETLTVDEYKRLLYLIDYVHEKNIFLAKARKTVQAFYMPMPA